MATPNEILAWLAGGAAVAVPIVAVFSKLFERIRKVEGDVRYLEGVLGADKSAKARAEAKDTVRHVYKSRRGR